MIAGVMGASGPTHSRGKVVLYFLSPARDGDLCRFIDWNIFRAVLEWTCAEGGRICIFGICPKRSCLGFGPHRILARRMPLLLRELRSVELIAPAPAAVIRMFRVIQTIPNQ